MAGELTVLGEVAGKDHQVGLVRHDLIHGLFDDVAGLTEHLAVGVLGDREVGQSEYRRLEKKCVSER